MITFRYTVAVTDIPWCYNNPSICGNTGCDGIQCVCEEDKIYHGPSDCRGIYTNFYVCALEEDLWPCYGGYALLDTSDIRITFVQVNLSIKMYEFKSLTPYHILLGISRWHNFYPTAFRPCAVIVFTNGFWIGRRAAGWEVGQWE